GSDSARAQHLFGEKFPTQAGDTVQLVFAAPAGVEAPAISSRITATLNDAKEVAHVRAVPAPMGARDGTVAGATVQLGRTAEKVPVSTIHSLMHLASAQRGDGVNVEAGGAAVQNAESGDAGSEQFGMLAAIVILLIAFGSVLAAGLPVLVALFGLGVALASVELLNRIFMVPDWAPTLMTMIGIGIGIGIGIDYALFIITRYRSALAAGDEPEDAVVTALSTAGRAVLFAGSTVVIS